MVFMKPESALRRADELIAIGKQQRALETLLEVITSRRHRAWTKLHEPLMEKFLTLCVDLKKSQLAKDGLYQYKTISQSVSVKSLEDVIMNYLKLGEERCSEAQKAAKNAVIEIDDLEVLQTPESLLLSAVSGESQQDRTDRDMLAPWLKFVWESYKQCLDLLKNNNRVEKIYQEVARMGLRFCQQYNRRPEFRKLCDSIRTHFIQSQKYSQQTYSVNLQVPETQTLHLDTRLLQLDTAIGMELWLEAFKAVDDIHTFTTISKRAPKPQQLASYYDKVALVFWKAGNNVFHAATVLKLYVLYKEQKKTITQEELAHLSTKALLSILSIPLPTPRTQIDEHLETEQTLNEKQKRLSSLLSLSQIPTRASLIRDMIKQGVFNFVHPALKKLYEWLEVEFNPLNLSSKIEESIQFVDQLSQLDYSQYIPALRDVTVVRLLQQISQVYRTIELKRFINLAPTMDKHRLEIIIVNAAKNNDVQVKIEHKSNALIFGTDLNVSSARTTIRNETDSKTNIVQNMPNEQIRHQLTSISRVLYSSMEIINEKSNKERNDKLRQEIAATYFRDEVAQRKEIIKRREVIERYKEAQERVSQDKVKQAAIVSKTESDERKKEHQISREADQKRQVADAAAKKEQEEHRFNMKIAIDKLRESEIGRKIIEVVGEEKLYTTYDPESLSTLHIGAVIDHSREQKEKLKSQYKKVDYFIRAQHESEVPIIQEHSEREIHRRRDIQQVERESAIERCERLVRMEDDKRDFLQSIHGQRHEDYLKEMKEFEQRLNIERQQRLEQLRKEHIEKKKQEWRKAKELKKQQDIRAKLKSQEDARLASEREANKAKYQQLNAQTEKQRQIDAAIEEKLQKQKEASRTESTPTATRREGPYQSQDKPRTDNATWRRPQRDNDGNQQPSVDSNEKWHRRNDDQRPRGNDDTSSNQPGADEKWRSKPRPEQQYRDDQRGASSQQHRDDQRGPSSQQHRDDQRGPSSQQHRDDQRGVSSQQHREDQRGPSSQQHRDDQRGPSSQQHRDDQRGPSSQQHRDDQRGVSSQQHRDDQRGPSSQQHRDDQRGASSQQYRDDHRGASSQQHREDQRGTSSKQYRDDQRGGSSQQYRDDQRGASSRPQPSSERNADSSDNWRTVEKKRPNPPRTDFDRPSQQRPDESSSSSGAYRAKSRMTGDQPNEARDNTRSVPNSSDNWGRSDESSNWRAREKKRLNSWRGDDSDNENVRPGGTSNSPSTDNRRGANRDVAGGNRE